MQVSGVIISSYLLRNTLDILTAKCKGLCQKTLTTEEVVREAGKREITKIAENTQNNHILGNQ